MAARSATIPPTRQRGRRSTGSSRAGPPAVAGTPVMARSAVPIGRQGASRWRPSARYDARRLVVRWPIHDDERPIWVGAGEDRPGAPPRVLPGGTKAAKRTTNIDPSGKNGAKKAERSAGSRKQNVRSRAPKRWRQHDVEPRARPSLVAPIGWPDRRNRRTGGRQHSPRSRGVLRRGDDSRR